jgi:ATP-dependent DNA helicase RecQ
LPSPQEILERYWGYPAFRPLQEDIINSVLDGNDTVALLPTGGGKSVCYQVPALALGGLTLVISPLIALMKDQVARLRELDIPAACIYAGMHYMEVKSKLTTAVHGGYKLLYISPERLQTDMFRDYLPEMDVKLVAIDEAHCISQWGHDFRPNYMKIAEIKEDFPKVPFLALTASATEEVRDDIQKQLKMNRPNVFIQSFERHNIFYNAQYTENKTADILHKVNPGNTTLIYCRSRKQTETTARQLSQEGISAIYYHAGMAKTKREEAQRQWMENEYRIMSATTAFGMGIDKPDVRLVVHYDAPEHLEAYYQEAGRAGRDGKPSEAFLLYNRSDIKRLENSTEIQYPPEEYLRHIYQSVAEYLQIPIGNQPDQYFSFELLDFCTKFKLEAAPATYALKLLAQEGLWTLSEAVFKPATIHFVAERHAIDNIQDRYPILGAVATTLLRQYSTIFNFPTTVRLKHIAYLLRMTEEQLEASLQQLQNMGIIEYTKSIEGPQMFFHHLRVDSKHLLINTKRIHNLRQKHIARTEAMIAFLENETICRERMILTYFGEKPVKDCWHCDVCAKKNGQPGINNKNLRTELYTIITDNPHINITDLKRKYDKNMSDNIATIVREMVDEGKVVWQQNGNLIIAKLV